MKNIQETEAKLVYGNSDYDIIAYGDYVLCAVTGQKIPLRELRYWNVEKQEAYYDAKISLDRHIHSQIEKPLSD